jgi:hypothetical protein
MSQDTHHTSVTEGLGPSPEESEEFIADAVLRFFHAVAPEHHLTDESAHIIAMVMATLTAEPEQQRWLPWTKLTPDFCKKFITAAVVSGVHEMGQLITWDAARLVAEGMAETAAKNARL